MDGEPDYIMALILIFQRPVIRVTTLNENKRFLGQVTVTIGLGLGSVVTDDVAFGGAAY